MSRHLERLLRIDSFLRSSERQTATSMAVQLECSERTIRSDLNFLRDRYIAPVVYTKKKGFHYSDPDWRLPSVPLTQGELFALTLGARMLEAYSGSAYQTELEGAIARLSDRLPEPIRVDLQQLAEHNVLFRAGAEIDLKPETWQTLELACQKQRRVWIQYCTPGKDPSERELDPYILHISRNNPYVTGWCHLRAEVRWFRVDRIQKIELRSQVFEVDPSFDRKAHFADAFQHEVGGIPQEMVIWFDPPTAPYIRERQWHSTQQIQEHPDGSLTLRFVVRGLNEVKRWVLFYGAGAKVLAPPELVTMMTIEIATMYQEYSRGTT